MAPRKKRPARNQAREQAILESEITVDEAGLDTPPTGVPALDAVLSPEFVGASDKEALKMALALQDFLRGQASINSQLMAGISGISEHIQRLNARMDAYDTAAAQMHHDQQRFFEDVLQRAEKLKLPEGERKDKLVAQAGVDLQAKIAEARAQIAVDKVQFKQKLAAMPQDELIVSGRVEMVSGKPVIVGEEIRIKDQVWYLRPGHKYSVPRIVKERYDQMQFERAETDERKALLSADGDTPLRKDTDLAAKWDALPAKYGASAEPLSPWIATQTR